MKFYYRVVEINPAYDFQFGVGKGWICVSNAIYDYREALLAAIAHEKRTGLKTWIDCLMDQV